MARGHGWQGCLRGRGGGMHGRRDGHCSGRYASCWNVNLFTLCVYNNFVPLEYVSLRDYVFAGFCFRWHGWRRDGLYFQKYVGPLTGAAWLLRLSLFFWVSTETAGTESTAFVKKTSVVLLTLRCYIRSLKEIQNMNWKLALILGIIMW